jgi:phosphoglucomutase
MARRFAEETARVLTGSRIRTYLCNRDTSAPVVSHAILRGKTAGSLFSVRC